MASLIFLVNFDPYLAFPLAASNGANQSQSFWPAARKIGFDWLQGHSIT